MDCRIRWIDNGACQNKNSKFLPFATFCLVVKKIILFFFEWRGQSLNRIRRSKTLFFCGIPLLSANSMRHLVNTWLNDILLDTHHHLLVCWISIVLVFFFYSSIWNLDCPVLVDMGQESCLVDTLVHNNRTLNLEIINYF